VIDQWDNNEVVFSDPIIEHIDLPSIGLAGLIQKSLII
jgi:hypothetical protein